MTARGRRMRIARLAPLVPGLWFHNFKIVRLRRGRVLLLRRRRVGWREKREPSVTVTDVEIAASKVG
jgi:hypothetical protein